MPHFLLFGLALHAYESAVKVTVLDTPAGCGATATRKSKRGDILLLHFNSSFPNSTEIESTRVEGRSLFSLHLTENDRWLSEDPMSVLMPMRAFQEHLLGMCVGEVRELVVPATVGHLYKPQKIDMLTITYHVSTHFCSSERRNH